MGETTDIKKGAIIRHQNGLYLVTNFQFTNPGKGVAFTKVKMKNIATGKGVEITYKSGESVDTVQVQRQNMQYLYKSGDMYSFMNKDTYETVDIPKDVLGDDAKYLKDGLEVIAQVHEDIVVAIDLPKKITYQVAVAPDAVRGDSSGGNVTKEIELVNGLTIHAPIFIKEGEEVVVNTDTGDYCGRAIE